MKAKVTLHNLGGGFLGEQFRLIRKEFESKTDKVIKDNLGASVESEKAIRQDLAYMEKELKKKIFELDNEMRMKDARNAKRLDFMSTYFTRSINDLAILVNDLSRDSRAIASADAARIRGDTKLTWVKGQENMLEIMRQNVYLIEFLRELFDKEPRYDPRRWYDHGWR